MRLGIVAYIVPFIFVFHPALLFKGRSSKSAARSSPPSSALFSSHRRSRLPFRPLGWTKRIIMIIAGVALIPSASAPIWLASNLGGFVVAMIVVALEWKCRVPKIALANRAWAKLDHSH